MIDCTNKHFSKAKDVAVVFLGAFTHNDQEGAV